MVSTDNLVCYYKLDEISGTNADDAHSTNDGTASNADIFTSEATGIINTGADFSAGDRNISCFDFYAAVGGNDFSISLWAYIDTSNTNSQDLVGYFNDSKGLAIRASGNDLITYIYPNNKRITTTNAFSSSGWYHIVLTLDSSNVQKQYVNGSKVGQLSSNAMGDPIAYNLSLGSSASGPSGNPYGETLDEVAFFAEDIGSTGVTELYNSGNGLAYPFSSNPTITPTALALTLAQGSPNYLLDSTFSPTAQSISLTNGTPNPMVMDIATALPLSMSLGTPNKTVTETTSALGLTTSAQIISPVISIPSLGLSSSLGIGKPVIVRDSIQDSFTSRGTIGTDTVRLDRYEYKGQIYGTE
jgi:hypothetical protein